MNKVSLHAYSNGSTVVANSELERASKIRFTTQYPGGLYGALSAWAPRDPTSPWAVKPPYRLVAYNGLTPIWEGRVTSPNIEDQAAGRGQMLTALGYWGDVMMARNWRKWWADTRIDESAWVWNTAATAAEKCTLDTYNRLRFTPKQESWTTNQYANVIYTMPTGETVKRVTFNYDLTAGAGTWLVGLYDPVGVTYLWSTTTPGTGTVDHTLATPRQAVWLVFRSEGNITPASDGTIYGQFSSVTVYSETGNINLTEIAKDVRAKAGDLSASETLIGSNTYTLTPFISEIDTLADILIRATSYGDSSFNPWATGIRGSWLGADAKPVLFAEQQPALTDYDYIVSQGGANLTAPFRAVQDYSAIKNYIIVQYNDPSGRTVYTTPDDDANLKDTTSITSYGERHEILSIDTTSSAQAINWGRRFLAARKDPQWRVSSGIRIKGYVKSKAGGRVPACEIQAGKRIKIANYLNDLSGTGLTFLITGTDYDDENRTCNLAVGQPDTLAPYLARQQKGV